jgi:allantoicase
VTPDAPAPDAPAPGVPADLPLGPGGTVDLAGRALGATVAAWNDQSFAAAANLVTPGPATHDPAAFDARGKVYDGWETRRRRDPRPGDADWAVVRLATPGVVERVDVDTAFFRANHPVAASVQAADLPGRAGREQLADGAAWHELVAATPLAGDAVTALPVADGRRWSHVRLSIHPDGGVARLRVHGRPVPDPALLTGTVDLLAAELGGSVAAVSDEFYGSASRLLLPGRAASMGEGWENSRRRRPGCEWVLLALAAPGRVRRVELDTTWFVSNAPGRVRLLGIDARDGGSPDGWWSLLDVVPAPDTRHVLPLHPDGGPDPRPLTHLLLEAHPDGGLARLRLWGELDEPALAAAAERWARTSP